MSLEKQAESLLEAVTNLISNVTTMISGQKPTSINAADIDKGQTGEAVITKKALAELKKAAKATGGEVLKKLGQEKLKELLGSFGAVKLSDVKGDPETLNGFITAAEKMLGVDTVLGPAEDDDLLGDGLTEEKEYTLEDVKALLLKVNKAPGLGRDVTRQILADLGVARLPELKKDKFAEAVKIIENTLVAQV